MRTESATFFGAAPPPARADHSAGGTSSASLTHATQGYTVARMARARGSSTVPPLDASARIVVAAGKESFLRGEATRRLADSLAERFGAVGEFRFDGATAALADVLDELRSYGLLQSHKLVIVDDADEFLARGESGDEGDGGEPGGSGDRGGRNRRGLEGYAANPSPDATLLLRATTWRPGKLDKLVEKVGAIVKCDPPGDAEATSWCIARARQAHGARLDPAAAQLLVARVGPDLSRLDTELGKLGAYVDRGAAIGRDDVVAMVPPSRQEQAWVLQSALLTGRPAAAVRKVRELLGVSRQPEELVMWAIGDLLRRIHAASRLLRQGASAGALRKDLRLWGDDGGRIIEVARRGDPDALARLLGRAVEADLRSKSGLGEAAANLEALAIEVSDGIGSA